jgi:hypothetical protein
VNKPFNGMKVFSATKARDRGELGERITSWLREHGDIEIVDKKVTQSSDKEFHCLTVTLFFRDRDSTATALSA